ncbi:MAG TPA: SCO family protein [Bryobacteraceae bacterium]|jgi:protein SCO1/2
MIRLFAIALCLFAVISGGLCGEENVRTAPRIPDVELINQHGQKVHLYSDLIKGHTFIINTIFTTCTTICPRMGSNYSSLQKILKARGAHNINLISISIDPLVDTPERLRRWSETFGAAPEWTLLTGTRSNVDTVLQALRLFAADKNEHTSMVLIGDESGTSWTRADALTAPSRLADIVLATRKTP